MRSVLLGVALSGWLAGPALAQCVYVACPGSSASSTMSSSSSSSSSSMSSGMSQHEVSQHVIIKPDTTETFVREEVVHEPAAHASHHGQHQRHTQHAYRHGYRDGYRDGYADRGKPKSRATKARTRASVAPSSHRRTATKAKRTSSAGSGLTQVRTWTHETRPYSDPIKDRASTYEAAANGSAISLASASNSASSSSWSSSSSSSSWSSQGGTMSWPAPAMTMQQGGMVCGWSIQTLTTPDGRTLPPQQTWVCQCPQGWRPPGY